MCLRALQALSKLVRYMTWANRRDSIDAALVLVGELKLPLMASLLGARYIRMVAKCLELRRHKARIVAAAQAAGLSTDDMTAAQLLFKEHTCDHEPSTHIGKEQQKVSVHKWRYPCSWCQMV